MTILIAKWLIAVLSILSVSYLLEGVSVSGIYIAFIVSVILGVLNLTLRPLIFLLTLPINILTLGLFSWVINGLLLLFVASFVDGFMISGFWWAVLAAFLISVLSNLGNWLVEKIG